jgi:hypothetical protein
MNAMSYFVVVPGALIPESIAPQLPARAKLPRLASRLERARTEAFHPMTTQGAPHLDWLWSRFGGEGTPVSAPYAWRALNRASAIDVAPELPLWHADPVHFALARDRMLVTALDADAAPTADESGALAAVAAPIAAQFDATLRVIDARHWFLSFDPAWSIRTVPYDAALGRSAQDLLPQGDAAARWRKLLTEIQIAWHQQPLNERREAAGARTINGIWLHGGGNWQPLPRRPYEAIAAADPIVQGWGLASGLAPSGLLAPEAKPGKPDPFLAYEPQLLHHRCREDWETWLAALARCDELIDAHATHAFARGFRDVTLVLAGRHGVRTIVLQSSDRFRFWRRNALAALLAEPESA